MTARALLLLMTVSACSLTGQQETPPEPIPHDTLETLSQALAANNLPAILATLDPEVAISTGYGHDAFVTTWQDPAPGSWDRLKTRLDFIASLDGIMIKDTQQYPYWTRLNPDYLSPQVMDLLSPQTAQMAMLAGADWTPCSPCTPTAYSVEFRTPNGDTGLMDATDFLETIADWRITLNQQGGTWKITSLALGS